MPERGFQFVVNGVERTACVPPMSRLLDVLRHEWQLTGTKEGCGEGECGSCSVLLNGELVNSCLVPVAQVGGASVTTIEGVGEHSKLHPVQQAFLDCGGAQCGICTPGMVLATLHLLDKHPQPSEEQIREGLNGNLCRCTGYVRIFASVAQAAQVMHSQTLLQAWNELDSKQAAAAVLPCCGSRAWAQQLAGKRPFADPKTLLAAADEVWAALSPADWDEAFASHPRIGESKAPPSATTQSAEWSSKEQASAQEMRAEVRQRLQFGNEAYEQRFGRRYIVCATGKTAEEMLAILEMRLGHGPEQELQEAAEQQRQITQLRLRKWLQR